MLSAERFEILNISDHYINVAINSLSANIAILDDNGIILETNRSWQSFAQKNQLNARHDSVGLNYFDVCQSAQGSAAEVEKAHEAAAGIKAVLDGELEEFATE